MNCNNEIEKNEITYSHPQFACDDCGLVQVDELSPEQALDALVSDAVHWGVQEPEEKLVVFGFKALELANKVMTKKAMRGELEDITNPAGYFIRTASNYAAQIHALQARAAAPKKRNNGDGTTYLARKTKRSTANTSYNERGRNVPAPRAT